MPVEVAYVIWGLGAIGLASVIYRAVRNRGLVGAMLGAPVERTVELDLGRRGGIGRTLKVHKLQSGDADSPAVGIEVVVRTFGSIGMTAIPLTREQAGAMRALLAKALDHTEAAD